MTFPRAHLGLLLDAAARILEVRREVHAKDLLDSFAGACVAAGQDALLETFDPDAVEPTLAAELAAKYDAGGPRNAKPRILVDCLLASLGIELVDDPTPPTSLSDDVRKEIAAAATAVLEPALVPAQLRADIIAAARSATPAAQHGTFDKIAAALDDRGLKMTKQPKVPLDIDQAVQKNLVLARERVIGGAVRAALDRAKAIIARADADVAARIDAPVTLRLTPRDVVVHRIMDARVPKTAALVVPVFVDALAQLARITWRAAEKTARPYSAKDTFAVGELVEHPKFGRGTVKSVATQKIDVEFADATRALVHAKS